MKTGFANPNFTPSSIAAISGSLAGTSSSSSQRTTNVASNGAVITASTHDNRTSSTYNNNEKSNTTTTISSALKSTITKKEKQRSVSSSTKALIYPSLHWCTIDMTANLLRQHHVLVTLSKDVIDDISRMTIPELYDFEFGKLLFLYCFCCVSWV